jgi:hypothetical protein
MDFHKHTTQIEQLNVVQTGRLGRWSDEEKLRTVFESLETPHAIKQTRIDASFSIWSRQAGKDLNILG